MRTMIASCALAWSISAGCGGDGRLPIHVTVQETNVQFACPDEQIGHYESVMLDCGGTRHVYLCSDEELCEADIAAVIAPIVSCDESRAEYEFVPGDGCGSAD